MLTEAVAAAGPRGEAGTAELNATAVAGIMQWLLAVVVASAHVGASLFNKPLDQLQMTIVAGKV